MSVGEIGTRGHELALVGRPLLVVQTPPCRVDLQKGVFDKVPDGHLHDHTWPQRLGRTGVGDIMARMRIALVSPYSWTYPGGVTRHIQALAESFIADGHHVRVLAPYDPVDLHSR